MANSAPRASRIAAIGISIGLAVSVGYLSLPRAMAGIALFDQDFAFEDLRAGGKVTSASVERMIAARKSALTWMSHGQLWADYGYLLTIRRVLGPPNEAASSARRKEAQKALVTALKHNPTNSDAWRWIAVERIDYQEDRKAAAAALRQSIYTGPFVGFLAIPRLRLMLELWDQFEASERWMVYRQIRFAWRVSEDQLLKLALQSRSLAPYRIALAQSPADLARFELKLREAKTKTRRR